jgi:hypothetical protein
MKTRGIKIGRDGRVYLRRSGQIIGKTLSMKVEGGCAPGAVKTRRVWGFISSMPLPVNDDGGVAHSGTSYYPTQRRAALALYYYYLTWVIPLDRLIAIDPNYQEGKR